MFSRRSVMATAVAGALLVSACGTTSDGAAAQVPGAPAATQAPTTDAAEALTPTPTQASSEATNPPPDTPVDTEAPVATEAATGPVSTEVPATEVPATEVPATDAPVVTEPPVTDPPSIVPPPAEVGGRAFAETLAASSDIATNPLPDLVVDDIRRGAKINIRNVFPADRPVLVWMWAPH